MEKIDWKFAETILNHMDNYTYYKTSTIRNDYLEKTLNLKIWDISESNIKKISSKIRKFNTELIKLGIVEKYRSKTYRNLSRGSLFFEFDKRMRDTYLIIGVKK